MRSCFQNISAQRHETFHWRSEQRQATRFRFKNTTNYDSDTINTENRQRLQNVVQFTNKSETLLAIIYRPYQHATFCFNDLFVIETSTNLVPKALLFLSAVRVDPRLPVYIHIGDLWFLALIYFKVIHCVLNSGDLISSKKGVNNHNYTHSHGKTQGGKEEKRKRKKVKKKKERRSQHKSH